LHRLELEVVDHELDATELDEALVRLGRQLRDLDIDGMQRASGGPAPPGAKGDFVEVATLLVAITDSQALAAIVRTVRSWLGGSRGPRRVRLTLDGDELEVYGLSSDAQDQLIRAWLSRHRAR
jgi:hypothetical protein